MNKVPEMTVAAQAKALRISPRRVSQLRLEGMPHDLIGAKAFRKARQEAGEASPEKLRAERIALIQSQRRKIDLEHDTRRRDLIPHGEVKEGIIKIVSAAKFEFLKMANDLPPRLEGLEAPAILKILRTEMIGVLTRLSSDLNKAYDAESTI